MLFTAQVKPSRTMEVEDWGVLACCWLVRWWKKGEKGTYTARVKNFHRDKGALLGDAIRPRADRASGVGPVAVVVDEVAAGEGVVA